MRDTCNETLDESLFFISIFSSLAIQIKFDSTHLNDLLRLFTLSAVDCKCK